MKMNNIYNNYFNFDGSGSTFLVACLSSINDSPMLHEGVVVHTKYAVFQLKQCKIQPAEKGPIYVDIGPNNVTLSDVTLDITSDLSINSVDIKRRISDILEGRNSMAAEKLEAATDKIKLEIKTKKERLKKIKADLNSYYGKAAKYQKSNTKDILVRELMERVAEGDLAPAQLLRKLYDQEVWVDEHKNGYSYDDYNYNYSYSGWGIHEEYDEISDALKALEQELAFIEHTYQQIEYDDIHIVPFNESFVYCSCQRFPPGVVKPRDIKNDHDLINDINSTISAKFSGDSFVDESVADVKLVNVYNVVDNARGRNLLLEIDAPFINDSSFKLKCKLSKLDISEHVLTLLEPYLNELIASPALKNVREWVDTKTYGQTVHAYYTLSYGDVIKNKSLERLIVLGGFNF